MDTEVHSTVVLEEILARGLALDDGTPAGARETCRDYLREILDAFAGQRTVGYAAAEALGLEWYDAGAELGGLARNTARLGRAVEAAFESRGELPAAERHRLRLFAEEAAAHALEAFATAATSRRERWLSHYAHEMRNALNTLVNAHWILRNGEGKNTVKVCDMAERAVRRLESTVKEWRELETQARKPAPGRPDLS